MTNAVERILIRIKCWLGFHEWIFNGMRCMHCGKGRFATEFDDFLRRNK